MKTTPYDAKVAAPTSTEPESSQRLLAILLHLRSVESSDEEATRSRIIDVAIEMFTGRGYAGTPMRAIASGVGIKAASIYAHFPSGKEELLKAALQEILDEFLAFVVAPLTVDMPVDAQLRTILERHVVWQLTQEQKAPAWDAAIRQFGIAGVLSEDDIASIRAQQELYHDYVTCLVRCQTESRAREKALAVVALCDQSPFWSLDDGGGEQSAADVAELVWDFTRAILHS